MQMGRQPSKIWDLASELLRLIRSPMLYSRLAMPARWGGQWLEKARRKDCEKVDGCQWVENFWSIASSDASSSPSNLLSPIVCISHTQTPLALSEAQFLPVLSPLLAVSLSLCHFLSLSPCLPPSLSRCSSRKLTPDSLPHITRNTHSVTCNLDVIVADGGVDLSLPDL